MTELEILQYPHPTLRYKSKSVKRVDRQLKAIVQEMFELMYDANGIGLAANQVDLPLQLFIANTTGEQNSGEELVFVNPVIDSPKGTQEAEEGCLSLPGIQGQVSRPAQVRISAYDLSGATIEMPVDGLLARVVQHEFDHLQGVLFIDRLSDSAVKQVRDELEGLKLEFENSRAAGDLPSDDDILNHLKELETAYCT